MKRLAFVLAVFLTGCHPTTAPKECTGIIAKGGPWHADTLALKCR